VAILSLLAGKIEKRRRRMRELAQLLRMKISKLIKKDYWDQNFDKKASVLKSLHRASLAIAAAGAFGISSGKKTSSYLIDWRMV